MALRAKKKKKVNLQQTAFTRFTLIVAVLVLWMGGIGVRLVHLQVTKHEWLKERAEGQRRDIKRSKLPRGTILDRNESVLAMSLRVKTLYADATAIDDTKTAAKAIAKTLNVKESDLAKQLAEAKADEKKFLPLVKGLDEETYQKINKALEDPSVKKADLPKFNGLHWREDQKRSYPNQTLAAHIIGFSNADGVGQAGIEQSQNDILFGAVIKKLQERDRLGRVYDETVSEKEPPKDIVLTISKPIQYMTEQALEKAVKASSARSGIAIVLDNNTGEILAMANYPSFDPNKLNEITAENLSNAAIQGVYSPGSAMKLVTYSSALERKLISPEAEIDSGNGTIEIAKHKFTDSHAIGRVTYSKAFAQSSNVCAIKTGMRVGKEGFYETLQNFGFGMPTGIELPAETGGIVRNPDRWNGDSLASMSIGYEIGVSALQMATAFATIANNGVRIKPHIIKEIRQSDDQIVPVAQPEKIQVVSAETARDMRTMLRQVVVAGTARRAQLNGYTSAGKTGTAWKFDEKLKKVNSAKYVSSFIGFAPAENPAVTIAVVMDEPKVGGRDGGQVAGPVFREIAQQILPELNVRPEGYVAEEEVVEDIPELPAGGGPSALSVDDHVAENAARESVKVKIPAVKTPAKKESKPENVETKPVTVAKPTKIKQPEKDVRSKAVKPEKPEPEAKPKSLIKNKSSTEKKKGKT
ncbi:MAG: penicillin-binding transpeptidase domain-containing protein [Pyrinomonadaceae bacterium]